MFSASSIAALSCCSASRCPGTKISELSSIRLSNAPSCKTSNNVRKPTICHAFSSQSSFLFQSAAFAAANPSEVLPEASTKAAGNSLSVSQAVAENAGDDMVVTILGSAAFIGVIVLTLAVTYLAVIEFLEKRARDEETKKLIEESKSSKKKLSRVGRGGPKGFGKRVEDSD